MHEASFYDVKEGRVICRLCPHTCRIDDGGRGICRVRRNMGGTLVTEVYGRCTGLAVDPIEKKPLYHFNPGKDILSIGTVGCNLSCGFCQNYTTSMAEGGSYPLEEAPPGEVVDLCVKRDFGMIAFTYNEPTVFYEYMLDMAVAAKGQGLKTVIVSNGFINRAPMEGLMENLDAANIDLKAFDDGFYKRACGGRLEPVLKTLKLLKSRGVWLEITNLLIPGENTEAGMIRGLCGWVRENLGPDVPLHFSAFHPAYKYTDAPSTSPEVLLKAKGIAREAGLRFVYLGNTTLHGENDTLCPDCGKVIIRRSGRNVEMDGSQCSCGGRIPGVFEDPPNSG